MVVVAAGLVLLPPASAGAQTVKVTLGQGGVTGQVGVPGGEAEVTELSVDENGRHISTTYAPISDDGCSGRPGVPLERWGQTRVTVRDADSGEEVRRPWDYCGEPPTGTPGSPEVAGPPPPPPPPSPEEVWAFVPLPRDEVNISPHIEGLVGLDTWLWYDEATTVPVPTLSVRGWSVATEVWVESMCWDMGYDTDADGYSRNDRYAADDRVCSDRAGTEGWPSATWVYPHECHDCTVTMTVTWTGRYTVSGPFDPAGQTFDLGTEALSADRVYNVKEIEAVGRPAG